MISLNVGGITRNSIRNTEVNQLQLAFDEDEIGRLQIGMNDLLFMYNMNCLKHLLPVVCDPDHIHRLFLLLLEKFCKIFTERKMLLMRVGLKKRTDRFHHIP